MKTKTLLLLTMAALLLAACGPAQPDADAVSTQVALLMQQNEPPPAEQAPEEAPAEIEAPGQQGGVLLPPLPSDASCVPNSTLRILATVSHVWSGDSIQVNTNGQTYEVRYIGIDSEDLPADANSELVLGKEVMLISDEQDVDEYGRLPRYVVVDGIFVNLELVRRGAAYAAPKEPNRACDNVFARAQP